ncbi:MAG: APC family permease [Capsulimonadaceae bacterium]
MSIPTSATPRPEPEELPPPPRYESAVGRVRRLIFGRPLETSREAREKLPVFLALPIFSSDALSSNAYATEAILSVLAGAGILGALTYAVPISIGISALLLVVVLSYRQIIFAYPDGGGAYPVSRDNLGTLASLVAAASLLVDYTLTVATSVAAGVDALITLNGAFQPYLVPLCLLSIAILTLANLRGVRETGWTFAGPAYLFIGSVILTIVAGAVAIALHAPYVAKVAAAGSIMTHSHVAIRAIGWYLLLRAFSMGCTALTGVEAISNTVPVFVEPRARNAALTTLWMGGLAVVMFFGLTWLSAEFGIHAMDPSSPGYMTVVGQVAYHAWPHPLHFMFWIVQISTAVILIIAANAAFAGFPQLASMLARDGFMPRQLAHVGDRLSFANGIAVLALLAAWLVWIFHGIVNSLLSLYAIGVFTSFTLAQIGMVRHWLRERQLGWQTSLFFNAVGAVATGAVTLIIAVSKFADGARINPQFIIRLNGYVYHPHYGAWLVIVVVPLMVAIFYKINRHYLEVALELSLDNYVPVVPTTNVVLVLVPRLHRGIVDALNYARLISDDTRAVYMETNPLLTPRLKSDWDCWGGDIPLVILHSPYRSLIGPLLNYIDAVQRERKDDVVTVVLPEMVTRKWWHKLLHNQMGPILRLILSSRRDVVITSVRYFVDH